MSCYETLSIVISAFGTIATFLAVIVALWQTKYSNKKKIKLTYTESFEVIQNAVTGKVENMSYRYTQVNITNIGNRKIVIKNWFIYFSNDFTMQIINKNGERLPFTLNVEESLMLRMKLLDIKQILINNQKEIEKYRNKKLMFLIYDSAGKKYTIKTKRKIIDILQSDDSEFVIQFKN